MHFKWGTKLIKNVPVLQTLRTEHLTVCSKGSHDQTRVSREPQRKIDWMLTSSLSLACSSRTLLRRFANSCRTCPMRCVLSPSSYFAFFRSTSTSFLSLPRVIPKELKKTWSYETMVRVHASWCSHVMLVRRNWGGDQKRHSWFRQWSQLSRHDVWGDMYTPTLGRMAR